MYLNQSSTDQNLQGIDLSFLSQTGFLITQSPEDQKVLIYLNRYIADPRHLNDLIHSILINTILVNRLFSYCRDVDITYRFLVIVVSIVTRQNNIIITKYLPFTSIDYKQGNILLNSPMIDMRYKLE